MNIFSPHIPFPELVDLADENHATADEVLQHLSACSQCSSALERLRQTIGLMRSDTTDDTPVRLVANARNIFRSRPVSRKAGREVSFAQRVVASLAFDSLTATPAFGLRSQTTGGRQLIYSTETADIEVRVSPENEVAGQILGARNCENGDVNLESEGFSASAKLNELCEFSFGSVPAGTYKISVHLPDLLVETPELELGP
jgi:hypothetical protein